MLFFVLVFRCSTKATDYQYPRQGAFGLPHFLGSQHDGKLIQIQCNASSNQDAFLHACAEAQF